MAVTTGQIRLGQLVAAMLVVGLAAWQIDPPFYTSWWFFVAATTAVSAVLVEPHYTAPRASLVNAVIPISSFVVADRTGVELAWIILLVLSIVVFLSSTFLVGNLLESATTWLRWLSARLGRASLLGGAPLLIESMRVSSTTIADGVSLLVATAVFLAATALDLPRVLLPRGKRLRFAVLEAAVAPNLLLFSSESDLAPGQKVEISKGSSSIPGYVVGRLAHKRANRYQVVTDPSWRTVLPEAGTECNIAPSAEDDSTVGFVVEGTDELAIRLQPLSDLEHGQALVLENAGARFLYQVTSLRLERDQWDNSAGLQARAVAAQIGQLSDNSISLRPWLPRPFHPVQETGDLAGELPEGVFTDRACG